MTADVDLEIRRVRLTGEVFTAEVAVRYGGGGVVQRRSVQGFLARTERMIRTVRTSVS